jgi:hypothetical protein
MVDRVIKIGERFGVPVMLLTALLFFAREVCVSVHETLLVPIVKGHIEFLDATSLTLREIEQTQHQLYNTLQEVSIGQRAIQQALSGDPKTGGLE